MKQIQMYYFDHAKYFSNLLFRYGLHNILFALGGGLRWLAISFTYGMPLFAWKKYRKNILNFNYDLGNPCTANFQKKEIVVTCNV